jgi:hypothetical protein
MKRSPVGLVIVALLIVAALWLRGPEVIEVAPGTAVGAVASQAPEGTVIRLLPGRHDGFAIGRRLTVEGGPGATVRGPVAVMADDVVIMDLRVIGGDSGIVVQGATGVELLGVSVRGANLHGIEVSGGSAIVRGCSVEGLMSPYGQGVEVRNSTGLPHTVVQGCRISSGQEGLVSHVARVEFLDNVISGSTQRAIAVTEMSEGLVEGNLVLDVDGSALYCGDMSHCEFRSNDVRGVGANADGGAWQQGYAAVGIFHSRMYLDGNTFHRIAAPAPVRLSLEATMSDHSPLSLWPNGLRGAVPAMWVAGIALAAVAGIGALVRPFVRRRLERLAAADVPPVRVVRPTVAFVIVAGLLVQGFHMVEHVVQVFQVYVLEATQRSGILGSVVDTEWVHFAYNAAVLLFLGALVRPLWRGRLGVDALTRAGVPLLAALLVQAYHFVEHTAKVVQHVSTGATPAPGLVGGRAGLVWFHFGINLAVYVGQAIGVVMLARAGVLRSLTQPRETPIVRAA